MYCTDVNSHILGKMSVLCVSLTNSPFSLEIIVKVSYKSDNIVAKEIQYTCNMHLRMKNYKIE